MGIIHFAGLGRSPGAVTAGLAYLKHAYGDRPEYGQIIEGVVLFTSPEVANGSEKAFEAEHNEYMSLKAKQKWPRETTSVGDIIARFFEAEIGQGSVYFCPVNVNDFSACFEAVAKATLRFHRPGEIGKHLWANITGGTNPLNAALFQVAYLSGFISRLYYTFIADPRTYGKYLQPFSRDTSVFDFREIYVLKTSFDDRYQNILEELDAIAREDPNRWLTGQELLGRLKSKGILGFQDMDLRTFTLDFLHVMQGRGIQRRDKDDAIRLDPEIGSKILGLLRSKLVQALFQRQALSDEDIDQLTADLRISELRRGRR